MLRLDWRVTSLALISSRALAQAPDVAPTAFEAFVSDPNVLVRQETLLGRFRGIDSTIEIYAIEAEDQSTPGTSAAGARIDLANNAWRTSVFLDPEELAQLSSDLASMARYQEDFENDPDPELLIGWRGRGTSACWMPTEPQRVLCPNLLTREGFVSFSVNAYGSNESFPFATGELADLAARLNGANAYFDRRDPVEDSVPVTRSLDPTAAARDRVTAIAVDVEPRRAQATKSLDEPIDGSKISATGTNGQRFMILLGVLFSGAAVVLIRKLRGRAR